MELYALIGFYKKPMRCLKRGRKRRIIFPKAIVFCKFFSLNCYCYYEFLLITYQSGIRASNGPWWHAINLMLNFVKRFKKSLLDMSPILIKFTPHFKQSLPNFNPYVSNTLPRKGRSTHSPQLTSLHTSQSHFPPPNQIGPIPSSNFIFQSLVVMTLLDGFTKPNGTLIYKTLLWNNKSNWPLSISKGIALECYRWLTKFKGPQTWTEFTKAILLHFGPTDYEDPSEALTRLKQTSSVTKY